MGLEAIAERLMMIRSALNMTQTQFCEHVGISQQALNNYERARRRIDLDQASRITHATGATLDWIYHGKADALPVRLYQKMKFRLEADLSG